MNSNPSGGSNEKQIVAYKNVASGAFGTYSSAVTKNQYQALIATYPGIVDVVTQAQREIDPQDLKWMNVIRVSALTTSPWSQGQIQSFLAYCQKVTMYAAYFHWQDAIPVPRDVDITVYVYSSAVPTQVQQNSVDAITKLFAPRPGLLMTNFYDYDLKEVIANASPGQISYVKVNVPTQDMLVTSPLSPPITYQILPGQGSLGELVYAYGVSTVLQYTDTNGNVIVEEGYPTSWVFPQVVTNVANIGIQLTWPKVLNAIQYKVWGRTPSGTGLGLLATVNADPSNPQTYGYLDTGAATPTGTVPTSKDFPIKYNSLRSLNIQVVYSERQQRQFGEDPTRLLGG